MELPTPEQMEEMKLDFMIEPRWVEPSLKQVRDKVFVLLEIAAELIKEINILKGAGK